MNVQLSAHERCQAYIDVESGRLLGFGPEGAKPAFPPGKKIRAEVLFHAADIERYMNRFREQSLRDMEEQTEQRLEAERPHRQAIFDAVNERNRHVDARNRDINNALLKAMDFYYHNALTARRNATIAMMAEKAEANKSSIDVGLDSPYVKKAIRDAANG